MEYKVRATAILSSFKSYCIFDINVAVLQLIAHVLRNLLKYIVSVTFKKFVRAIYEIEFNKHNTDKIFRFL